MVDDEELYNIKFFVELYATLKNPIKYQSKKLTHLVLVCVLVCVLVELLDVDDKVVVSCPFTQPIINIKNNITCNECIFVYSSKHRSLTSQRRTSCIDFVAFKFSCSLVFYPIVLGRTKVSMHSHVHFAIVYLHALIKNATIGHRSVHEHPSC